MKKILAAGYLLTHCSIPGFVDPKPEPLQQPDCEVYPDNPYCVEQRRKTQETTPTENPLPPK